MDLCIQSVHACTNLLEFVVYSRGHGKVHVLFTLHSRATVIAVSVSNLCYYVNVAHMRLNGKLRAALLAFKTTQAMPVCAEYSEQATIVSSTT